MRNFVNEMLSRPLHAAAAGFGVLSSYGASVQGAEAAFARAANMMSVGKIGRDTQRHRNPVNGLTTANGTQRRRSGGRRVEIVGVTADLEQDADLVPSVEEYLARGIALKRWWDEVERNGGPEHTFPLERNFNQPTRAFGFYGEAPVGGSLMPVMGNVQEMFYDQTRGPASPGRDSAEWMWAQIREFVMKYFMRVSSFRVPETYTDTSQPEPPPALRWLSLCPAPVVERIGFGFSQLFYRPIASAAVYAFPTYDHSAIVDQRDVGRLYEWLMLRVRIFNFDVRTRPFGARGPELVFELNEESHLVVHEEFVRHRERPLPGVLGDYGIGYAFIKNPVETFFGYGPGEFDAAIELINFRVYETGYVSVRMVFVSNRPTRIANLVIDPVDWSFRIADAFSFGLASRLFWPARIVLDRLPLRFEFDPVYTYVDTANAISNGAAARNLCISREQLERLFLVQHFRQHYETVVGSLLTWRAIPDWLDEKNLPSWVISGLSS